MATNEAANDDNGAQEASRPRKQRAGSKELVQTIDELAVETKRTSLLDRLESQLKDQHMVSRILFGFALPDDKKLYKLIDQEFLNWRQKQDNQAEDLTGVLLFAPQVGLHFLEGPTEQIFKVLEFFNSISTEAEQAVPSAKPLTGKVDVQPMLSSVRVLHFTELHGVRSSRSWCSVVHTGKAIGASQIALDEASCPDLVFSVYRKLMCMCLKVLQSSTSDHPDAIDSTTLQRFYRKVADDLPSVDEVLSLFTKASSELFFSFAEFNKVFIAPFQLVLHSELLWPIPPSLTY